MTGTLINMIVIKTTIIHLYPPEYDIISIKALARVPLVPG